MKKPTFTHGLLAALLAGASGAALAHDTWFARLGALGGGEPLLALGTGNAFPVHEFAVGPEFLVQQGCRWPDGQVQALQPVRVTDKSLVLRTGQPGATGCWAQLQPFEVEVAADKTEVYLNEINASPALRATWAQMHARGVPWKERYTKHARIVLGASPPAAATPAASWAPDMAMDIRQLAGAQPAHAGETLEFEVRRDGKPVVALPLELRLTTDPVGPTDRWHRTDNRGRVRVVPAAPGRWLLRGTELQLSSTRPDQWDSHFITLAFDVEARTPKSAN